MTEKNRKKLSAAIYYRVVALLQKPLPFFVATLFINVFVACFIYVGFRGTRSFAPSSALQYLEAVVESSATILAIFFASVAYLLERGSPVLKRAFRRGGFFSAYFNFSVLILLGLINMAIIEPDKRVDGTVIIIPVYITIASLFLLFLIVYSLLSE